MTEGEFVCFLRITPGDEVFKSHLPAALIRAGAILLFIFSCKTQNDRKRRKESACIQPGCPGGIFLRKHPLRQAHFFRPGGSSDCRHLLQSPFPRPAARYRARQPEAFDSFEGCRLPGRRSGISASGRRRRRSAGRAAVMRRSLPLLPCSGAMQACGTAKIAST